MKYLLKQAPQRVLQGVSEVALDKEMLTLVSTGYYEPLLDLGLNPEPIKTIMRDKIAVADRPRGSPVKPPTMWDHLEVEP